MQTIRKTFIYLKKSIKSFFQTPSLTTLLDIIRYFPKWLKYMEPLRNSVNDRSPWLTFGAIEFIKKNIRRDMLVFEYGSGGSTLFWSDQVKKVISIEHEEEWFHRMQKEFRKNNAQNVEYILRKAEPDLEFENKAFDNPEHYISADTLFVKKNFKTYVQEIDRFPNSFFDVIVVDGRARPSCISHSINKVKINGYLIVDNSNRKYYLNSFEFNPKKWLRRDFNGAVPYDYDFSQTTILQRLK